MAKKTKTLAEQMKADFEDARQRLVLAAMDFSVPDDHLVEMHADLRRMSDEVRKTEQKSRKLFGIF